MSKDLDSGEIIHIFHLVEFFSILLHIKEKGPRIYLNLIDTTTIIFATRDQQVLLRESLEASEKIRYEDNAFYNCLSK